MLDAQNASTFVEKASSKPSVILMIIKGLLYGYFIIVTCCLGFTVYVCVFQSQHSTQIDIPGV